MKSAACCGQFLLRQDPLEQALMDTIQGRLDVLLAGRGEALLRQFIEEELAVT